MQQLMNIMNIIFCVSFLRYYRIYLAKKKRNLSCNDFELAIKSQSLSAEVIFRGIM